MKLLLWEQGASGVCTDVPKAKQGRACLISLSVEIWYKYLTKFFKPEVLCLVTILSPPAGRILLALSLPWMRTKKLKANCSGMMDRPRVSTVKSSSPWQTYFFDSVPLVPLAIQLWGKSHRHSSNVLWETSLVSGCTIQRPQMEGEHISLSFSEFSPWLVMFNRLSFYKQPPRSHIFMILL